MLKWSFGFLLGGFVVGVFAAGAGCSSSDTEPPAASADAQVAPADASTEAQPTVDAAQAPACLSQASTLTYQSPHVARGSCSEEQVTRFVSSCLGPDSDETQCRAFLDVTGNDHCVNDCLLTVKGATSFGPLVADSHSNSQLNYVGYYEINGISKACVDAQWAQFSCDVSSCGACSTDGETNDCLNTVYAQSGGQCYQLGEAAQTACSGEASKLDTLDYDLKSTVGLARVVSAFCGPVAADAGADAGDAGDDAGDAGDGG